MMQIHTSNRIQLPLTGILLTMLILFGSVSVLTAQLRQVPLERGVVKPVPSSVKASSVARTHATVSLPFFDDFSTTETFNANIEGSGYPRQDLWDESYDVWITGENGINSPSINVATFDGIDSAGRPYSNQVLLNGFRDMLTSNSIDLSTTAVTLAERPGVFLSFFYQWQGNGEAPDNNDFLRLEFLVMEPDSVWVPVWTRYGADENDRTAFTQVTIQLLENKYFHNEFRFRFRNYGNTSGPFDTWNVDYIYLDKNRTAANTGFPDRAVASGFTPIFGRYRSVPLQHFRSAPTYTPPQIDIQSLRTGAEGSPTDIYLEQSFMNYIDGNLTRIEKPFGPIGSKHPNNFLLPGERVTSLLRTDTDPINLADPAFNFDSYFLPEADSVDLRVRLELFEPDGPMFARNDTASTTYHLNNFYAYDDGSAEYSAVLNQSDDQVALAFDLLTPEPQQLVGFDIYIPLYSINGFTSVNFFVMDSQNGEPHQKLVSFTHIARTQSRDAFQSIFFDPVVVEGRFFIGWKSSSGNQIKVGLDYSNNTTDLIYEDLTGEMQEGKLKWFPTQSLTQGSLMIRPNFGTGSPTTGVVVEKARINLYPNPSSGTFYIDGSIEGTEILNISGQRIPFTRQSQGERTLITVPDAPSGLYLLKMKKGGSFVTEKFIINR